MEVIEEMVLTRGYSITDRVPVLHEYWEESLKGCTPDGEFRVIRARQKIGVSPLGDMLAMYPQGVIIFVGGMTPMATKAVPARVQCFEANYFTFNVLRHCDQPHFEYVSGDAVVDTCDLLGVSYGDLPIMRADDPVARFYGATPGDMFRITQGRYLCYRAIV